MSEAKQLVIEGVPAPVEVLRKVERVAPPDEGPYLRMTQVAFRGFFGRLNQRDKRRILRVRATGVSVRRIADMYGIGQTTVVRTYQEPALRPDEREDSLTEIATELNLSKLAAFEAEQRALAAALRNAVTLVAMASQRQWDDDILSDLWVAISVSREAVVGLLVDDDDGVEIDAAKVDALCEDMRRFQISMGERI